VLAEYLVRPEIHAVARAQHPVPFTSQVTVGLAPTVQILGRRNMTPETGEVIQPGMKTSGRKSLGEKATEGKTND
jgi:hypothetical protein